ncbi:MAG: hypothetical protein ACD_75C00083G0001 [uncultured bacterium]|nr:MAG: hypothetical protein ACD_75C00083G0001 [uncultured bacterium]
MIDVGIAFPDEGDGEAVGAVYNCNLPVSEGPQAFHDVFSQSKNIRWLNGPGGDDSEGQIRGKPDQALAKMVER